MNKYKITLSQAIKIHLTNKTFTFIEVEKNKVISLKFSDDLKRYRNKYSTFRLTEVIKQQTELLTII